MPPHIANLPTTDCIRNNILRNWALSLSPTAQRHWLLDRYCKFASKSLMLYPYQKTEEHEKRNLGESADIKPDYIQSKVVSRSSSSYWEEVVNKCRFLILLPWFRRYPCRNKCRSATWDIQLQTYATKNTNGCRTDKEISYTKRWNAYVNETWDTSQVSSLLFFWRKYDTT